MWATERRYREIRERVMTQSVSDYRVHMKHVGIVVKMQVLTQQVWDRA